MLAVEESAAEIVTWCNSGYAYILTVAVAWRALARGGLFPHVPSTAQFFSRQANPLGDATYRIECLQDELRSLLEKHRQKVKDADDHARRGSFTLTNPPPPNIGIYMLNGALGAMNLREPFRLPIALMIMGGWFGSYWFGVLIRWSGGPGGRVGEGVPGHGKTRHQLVTKTRSF